MNIPEALRLHQLWLAGDPSGVRFVAAGTLTGAPAPSDLAGANLTGTPAPSDLTGTVLSYANLTDTSGTPAPSDTSGAE